MRNLKKITLCSLLSALSVVLLWLGGLLSVLDLSAAVFASFAVIFARIEFRGGWAYSIWIVTSVLSLLLLPAKSAALYYAVLCGVYPILKSYYERLPRILAWLCKLVTFNALFAGLWCLAKYVFLLPDYTETGWLLAAVFVLGNVAFVCYDICLSMCITFYSVRLRKRIARFLK